MDIAKIVGIGVLCAILSVVLRVHRPEMGMMIGIAAGIFIFAMLAGRFFATVTVFQSIASRAGLNAEYLKTLVQIIGVGYLAEFGSQVCRDAGESAIASKVELGGKVIILAMSLPVLTSLLDLVISILPM